MDTIVVVAGFNLRPGKIVTALGEVETFDLTVNEAQQPHRVVLRFAAEAWPKILEYLQDPGQAEADARAQHERDQADRKEQADRDAARAKILGPGAAPAGPVIGTVTPMRRR